MIDACMSEQCIKVAWSDEKYIYFKTKIPIHIWFYVPNLDIGALTSSLERHIQNNH